MPSVICPKCKGAMRRSRTIDAAEKLLKLFGLKPYRCRECDWRCYVRRIGERVWYSGEKFWGYTLADASIKIAVTVVAIVIVFLLVRQFLR